VLLRYCRVAEAGKQGDARDQIAAHLVAPFVGQSPRGRSTQEA
jgi:hypothetical protein